MLLNETPRDTSTTKLILSRNIAFFRVRYVPHNDIFNDLSFSYFNVGLDFFLSALLKKNAARDQ